MAETWNQFFVPDFIFKFYSVSGSSATPSVLLPVLTWASVDLENSGQKRRYAIIEFFQVWSPMDQKLEEREFWFLET